MSAGVLALVLLAALLHAAWNALVKAGEDPFVRLAVVNLTIALLALPFALALSPPPGAAWPWLLASVAAHTVYYVTLARGYAEGDLSQVYPIARGLAPPLVALFALVIAGERPSLVGMIGILLVGAGVVALALDGPATRRPRAVASAVLCAVAIALYTVFDGLGVRASPHPGSYIAWLFLLEPFVFAAWVFARRGFGIGARGLRAAALGGLLSGIAYALVIFAMSLAPMAYVSALRETSVVMAAAIGVWLLRETMGVRRILSAALVAAGILLVRIGG